jgi:hypothetical protein
MAFTTALFAEPNAATAAVITLNATSAGRQFRYIYWSYSATPTGGQLSITNGGTEVFKLHITAGGPGFIPFPGTAVGTDGAAVVVTLASGGGSVEGTLVIAE